MSLSEIYPLTQAIGCIVNVQTLSDPLNEPLLFQVLNGLFQAQVQYTNTKQQPLIPDGVIKFGFHSLIAIYEFCNLLQFVYHSLFYYFYTLRLGLECR